MLELMDFYSRFTQGRGGLHKNEGKDRFKKVSPLTRMHSLELIEEAKG
jgi:hypothetical protein